jgi:hypothetical protein
LIQRVVYEKGYSISAGMRVKAINLTAILAPPTGYSSAPLVRGLSFLGSDLTDRLRTTEIFKIFNFSAVCELSGECPRAAREFVDCDNPEIGQYADFRGLQYSKRSALAITELG